MKSSHEFRLEGVLDPFTTGLPPRSMYKYREDLDTERERGRLEHDDVAERGERTRFLLVWYGVGSAMCVRGGALVGSNAGVDSEELSSGLPIFIDAVDNGLGMPDRSNDGRKL